MEKLTDDQLKVLGNSIGNAIVDRLWEKLRDENYQRHLYSTSDFVFKNLGDAIGKAMKKI